MRDLKFASFRYGKSRHDFGRRSYTEQRLSGWRNGHGIDARCFVPSDATRTYFAWNCLGLLITCRASLAISASSTTTWSFRQHLPHDRQSIWRHTDWVSSRTLSSNNVLLSGRSRSTNVRNCMSCVAFCTVYRSICFMSLIIGEVLVCLVKSCVHEPVLVQISPGITLQQNVAANRVVVNWWTRSVVKRRAPQKPVRLRDYLQMLLSRAV